MRYTDPRTTCRKGLARCWNDTREETTLKSQGEELSELFNDGDNSKIKATGVKCEWRSQLPQMTMDDKESGKRAKTKGDN